MKDMKIKKVAVLGAGAVGSYVIWGLSKREDIRLGVVAEGARAKRLAQGCKINDITYYPEVWNQQEAKGADLLIVAVKYGALPEALESIRMITAEIGDDKVLRSLIKVASHKEGDGYYFNPETTVGIIFGELKEPYKSECVQAILGAGVGCYVDSIHMKAISDGLRNELEAVAKAKGIDMSKTDESSGRGSAVPASARYSTLQDLDAGRHTEIDMFSGALMRMGKELGIPVPYNEFTYHMIKAMEEKNDRKFDYTGERDKTTWAK